MNGTAVIQVLRDFSKAHVLKTWSPAHIAVMGSGRTLSGWSVRKEDRVLGSWL